LAKQKPDPFEVADVLDGFLAQVEGGHYTSTTRRERAALQWLKGAATAMRALSEATREGLAVNTSPWTWGPVGKTGVVQPKADDSLSRFFSMVSRSRQAGWSMVNQVSNLGDSSASASAAITILISVLRAEQDEVSKRARSAWARQKVLGEAERKRTEDPRVARILELREEGLSLRAICRVLDSEGVATFSGRSRSWPAATVQWVVRAYGGEAAT
jgi:hypothetical protein